MANGELAEPSAACRQWAKFGRQRADETLAVLPLAQTCARALLSSLFRVGRSVVNLLVRHAAAVHLAATLEGRFLVCHSLTITIARFTIIRSPPSFLPLVELGFRWSLGIISNPPTRQTQE
jgi:hypothetical protein